MTEPPDPPPTIATMRTIGMVWAVVGGLAVVVGAIATVFAIVVFGILALLLGAGLVGIQHVRARSAIRASRTLTNAPVPPADPPSASPPGPPSGPPGPPPPRRTAADLSGRSRPDDEAEADVGSPGDGGSGDGSGDGAGEDSVVIEGELEDHPRERSISDEEDGTGSRNDEDPPRRDA